MEELSLHIEYLLLRHDCVVVPEIGAFINVRHSARYDETTRRWIPMSREVRFNGALRHDDGLLASSFARRAGISFGEGRELLRQSTGRMREILQEEGEMSLGSLGTLAMKEGALEFRPLYDCNRLSAILGYTPVPGERQSNHAENRKEVEPEYDTHKYYYIPVHKTFAKVAASLLILVVVALSVVLPSSHRQKIDEANVLPVERIAEAVLPTSALQEEDDCNKTEAAEESYHAIVATFSTDRDAQEFIAMHQGSGYDLRIVNGKTKSRVSALRSGDREELYRKMTTPEFKKTFSEAWIWEE